MRVALVEWGPGQDLEMMVEVWNTAALLEAVLEALLEDPQATAALLLEFAQAAARSH